MSRIFSQLTDDILYTIGIGGNLYVMSLNKQQIEMVCDSIEKSLFSIYFSKKYMCWTIRIKSKKHKDKFYSIYGDVA